MAVACACCGGGCENDEDCPPTCAEGEHLVYDASSQPYCCPEDRNYIGNSGGDCLLVPEGTPGDEDKVVASDIVQQCCCNDTCVVCPAICVFQVVDDCGYVTWDWQVGIDEAECSNYDNATLHIGSDLISIPAYTYANVGDCSTELNQPAQELDPCELMEPMSLLSIAGPGTELKALLSWLGFKARPGCKCKKRARYMDKMGCDWCEQNLGQITGWLQEEHARQKSIIPFVPMAVEQVVRLAIRRARKKGNSQ